MPPKDHAHHRPTQAPGLEKIACGSESESPVLPSWAPPRRLRWRDDLCVVRRGRCVCKTDSPSPVPGSAPAAGAVGCAPRPTCGNNHRPAAAFFQAAPRGREAERPRAGVLPGTKALQRHRPSSGFSREALSIPFRKELSDPPTRDTTIHPKKTSAPLREIPSRSHFLAFATRQIGADRKISSPWPRITSTNRTTNW